MGSHTTGSREAAGKPAAGSPSGHDPLGSGHGKGSPSHRWHARGSMWWLCRSLFALKRPAWAMPHQRTFEESACHASAESICGSALNQLCNHLLVQTAPIPQRLFFQSHMEIFRHVSYRQCRHDSNLTAKRSHRNPVSTNPTRSDPITNPPDTPTTPFLQPKPDIQNLF